MSFLSKKSFYRNILEPIFYGAILFAIVASIIFINADKKNNFNLSITTPNSTTNTKTTPIPASTTPKASKVSLGVPYISEAPNNIWTGPWKNACEEASIAMVEKYYKGEKTVSIEESKAFMQNLFDIEDQIFGSNANTDAEKSNYLVNNYSSYKGVVKINPTINDIKKQIDGGHPVIAFHNGFELKNPNIPFLPTGSAYHSTVVEGYDDIHQQFIVQDPGDEINGIGHRYDYNLYMNSLHDYNYTDKKADGFASVIFTSK
ncbi:MAG: C39 family peptidase [bacterium]